MRLIDADAFKQNIAAITIAENPAFPVIVRANKLCNMIDAQPTAINLSDIIAELDRRINTQLKIIAELNEPVHRYGFSKSLEAYQQCKLILEDLIQ